MANKAASKGSATKGTPATVALTQAKVSFDVHAYDHDASAQSYGTEAAEAMGVAGERGRRQEGRDGGSGGSRADDGLRAWRHLAARPAQEAADRDRRIRPRIRDGVLLRGPPRPGDRTRAGRPGPAHLGAHRADRPRLAFRLWIRLSRSTGQPSDRCPVGRRHATVHPPPPWHHIWYKSLGG